MRLTGGQGVRECVLLVGVRLVGGVVDGVGMYLRMDLEGWNGGEVCMLV